MQPRWQMRTRPRQPLRLCSPNRFGGGHGLRRLLLGHGGDELTGDLGLLGIELALCLTRRARLRRLLVGGGLVLCLLLTERRTFVPQAALVATKGIDGQLGVAARHVLVLRLRERVALAALEEDSVRRVHVDVGRHRFCL